MAKKNEGADEPVAGDLEVQVPKQDADSEEIGVLQDAIKKVTDKIRWHEEQIGDHKKDIKDHESQIQELRFQLRKQIGPLVGGGQNGSQRPAVANGRPTGELIEECLRTSGRPMDTREIKKYLEEKGNTTNPSVELSRMVKRGRLERAERGFYTLRAAQTRRPRGRPRKNPVASE